MFSSFYEPILKGNKTSCVWVIYILFYLYRSYIYGGVSDKTSGSNTIMSPILIISCQLKLFDVLKLKMLWKIFLFHTPAPLSHRKFSATHATRLFENKIWNVNVTLFSKVISWLFRKYNEEKLCLNKFYYSVIFFKVCDVDLLFNNRFLYENAFYF